MAKARLVLVLLGLMVSVVAIVKYYTLANDYERVKAENSRLDTALVASQESIKEYKRIVDANAKTLKEYSKRIDEITKEGKVLNDDIETMGRVSKEVGEYLDIVIPSDLVDRLRMVNEDPIH